MARYQIIESATGRKLNVIEYDGQAELSLPPGQRVEPDDGLAVYEAARVTSEMIDAERDRRLALGVIYLGRTYQTREFDIANLTGAATAAVAAMMQGVQAGDLRWADPSVDFAWIDIANAPVTMDAPALIGLAQAAMNRRAALIFSGRQIKNAIAAGATLDIGSDALWPT